MTRGNLVRYLGNVRLLDISCRNGRFIGSALVAFLFRGLACAPASPSTASSPAVVVEARSDQERSDQGHDSPRYADPDLPTAGAEYRGTYVCAQGETELALRILHVRGMRVLARFSFNHEPSGARGTYLMEGAYDLHHHVLRLEPLRWEDRPSGYEMVGMRGTLIHGIYAGDITYEGCSTFRLTQVDY